MHAAQEPGAAGGAGAQPAAPLAAAHGPAAGGGGAPPEGPPPGPPGPNDPNYERREFSFRDLAGFERVIIGLNNGEHDVQPLQSVARTVVSLTRSYLSSFADPEQLFNNIPGADRARAAYGRFVARDPLPEPLGEYVQQLVDYLHHWSGFSGQYPPVWWTKIRPNEIRPDNLFVLGDSTLSEASVGDVAVDRRVLLDVERISVMSPHFRLYALSRKNGVTSVLGSVVSFRCVCTELLDQVLARYPVAADKTEVMTYLIRAAKVVNIPSQMLHGVLCATTEIACLLSQFAGQRLHADLTGFWLGQAAQGASAPIPGTYSATSTASSRSN